MVATIRRAWRRARSLSSHGLVWARKTAVKVVLLGALVTFQLWLAFFLYGTFYYAYMPTELHSRPVFLDFSVCDRFDGSAACPFPNANVSLVKDQSRERIFMPGQKYHIRLEMEMPQSPVNEDLGVFMVKIQMFSNKDEITSVSLRPSMLRYRSPLLKIMDVVVLAPLYVTSYSEEKQRLNVDLLTDFVDNAYKPAVKFSIEVKAKRIEVYSSVLKIHAQFTGLRYLMFYWPLSSAVVSVLVNFSFLTVLTVMLWQQCVSSVLGEPPLEERDYGSLAPAMTYEERRRVARQSMERERTALFRNRPPHVTIVDPLDPPPDRRSLESPRSGHPGTSQEASSPPKGAQKSPRRRTTSRTREGGTSDPEQQGPDVQSSGVSSDNSDSNPKGGKVEVETLEGEGSSSGSLQSSASIVSDDSPSGYEKVDKDMIEEEKEDEEKREENGEEEGNDDKAPSVEGAEAASQVTETRKELSGILRHRSVPFS